MDVPMAFETSLWISKQQLEANDTCLSQRGLLSEGSQIIGPTR
jgi:hypothetical protein